MAVPSAVSKFTVTVSVLAGVNVTTNSAVPPSATAASAMDRVGRLLPRSSSSSMTRTVTGLSPFTGQSAFSSQTSWVKVTDPSNPSSS